MLLVAATGACGDASTSAADRGTQHRSVQRNKAKKPLTPGYWYSPDIVKERDAPLRSMPIKPTPVPPMFPAPTPYGPPGAVQPNSTYDGR